MENRLLRQPVFFWLPLRGAGSRSETERCCRSASWGGLQKTATSRGRLGDPPLQVRWNIAVHPVGARIARPMQPRGRPMAAPTGAVEHYAAPRRGRCPHRPVPRSGLAADGRLRDPPLQGAVQICRGRCPHRPDRAAAKTAPSASTKLSTVSTELSTAFVEKSREIPCNGSTVCDIIYIELFCLFPAIAMETP